MMVVLVVNAKQEFMAQLRLLLRCINEGKQTEKSNLLLKVRSQCTAFLVVLVVKVFTADWMDFYTGSWNES